MKLSFPPKKTSTAYYNTYCHYVRLNFDMLGIPVQLDDSLEHIAGAIFYIKVNDKLALIDFSDYYDECSWTYDKKGFSRTGKYYEYKDINVPIFKRTMIPSYKYPENVFPFGPFVPIASTDLYKTYYKIKNEPLNNPRKILHTNRIYAAATLTRKLAFNKINKKQLLPEVQFDETRVEKITHLTRLRNSIASLEIGACPHAQGAGAIEAFLLGTPVISNDMDIILPYNKKIEKNKHYIYVKDDYSNINEAINFAYSNRKEALSMSEQIYELYLKTWHPEPMVNWMEQVVENYYARK